MRKISKTILKYYLKCITKLVLSIHHPKIVAVSGSSNKTFIRDEIRSVLEKRGKVVRANPKNFNTEIGLPLAILNIRSGYNSYRAWFPVMLSAMAAIFQKNFPEYLVIELGVSRKGDMKYLLSIIRPDVSVVGDINQRYIESFSGMDDLVSEYEYLAGKTIRAVILNYDNPRVRSLAGKTDKKVGYFGRSEVENIFQIGEIRKTENGQKFQLKHEGKTEDVSILRFGEHNVYASAAGKVFEHLLEEK